MNDAQALKIWFEFQLERTGLTIEELRRRSGLAKGTVASIRAERGRAHAQTITRLEDAFGADFDPQEPVPGAVRVDFQADLQPEQTPTPEAGRRKRVPMAPIRSIPVGVDGEAMAEALANAFKDHWPNLTGDKGLYLVQLDEPSGGYQARTIVMVAPYRPLEPGKKVLADANGRRFVGEYQLQADGTPQVADGGIAHVAPRILGRVIGGITFDGPVPVPPMD